MVVKSARRSLIATVRPTWPLARSRAPTRSESRSSSRRMLRVSEMSTSKVSSAPMLLSRDRGGHDGALVAAPGEVVQVLADAPHRARAGAWPAVWRRGRRRCAGRAAAGSARCAPPRPTARRRAAGAGTRRRRRPGTTSRPSGLQRVEASLATNLVLATPTEQVMPCCSATWRRISWPISAGRPSRRSAPETSRNASSRASGSTSGVIESEDLHHARRDRGVLARAGAAAPPPAGRGAGPASSASPSARRTCAPRRRPPRPRPARRRRRRRPGGRAARGVRAARR